MGSKFGQLKSKFGEARLKTTVSFWPLLGAKGFAPTARENDCYGSRPYCISCT
jgi:hypothetical protein